MYDELEVLFENLGLPYSMQGTFYPDNFDIPEAFYTFWNRNSEDDLFADDEAKNTVWKWQVNYYTKNPESLYSGLENLITEARRLGFLVDGKGQGLPTGQADLYGRTIELKYVENN